jgi:hypothetical protein
LLESTVFAGWFEVDGVDGSGFEGALCKMRDGLRSLPERKQTGNEGAFHEKSIPGLSVEVLAALKRSLFLDAAN